MRYIVDLPKPDGTREKLGSFDSRQSAYEYCRQHFGAEEGMLSLVTEVPDDARTRSPKASPSMFQMLDISTKHINGVNDRDTRYLSQPPAGLWTLEYDYGWIIHVPSDLADPEYVEQCRRELPSSLLDILLYAHAVGADYIKLDADGEEYEGLPTYDW